MNAKRTIFFLVIAATCAAIWLLYDRSSSEADKVTETEIPKESSETKPIASIGREPEHPIHSEVIAKAESAGLSDEQLQDVQSNVGEIGLLALVLSRPIEFYGRVVDLEGNPVANAEVTYSAFNRFFENSPAQSTASDVDGYFSINDIKGGSINVRVSKEGYYQVDESRRSFGYAVPSDNPAADDPNNPAIFKLRKHGEAEPLVVFGQQWGRSWSIPRDGSAVGFDLIEGRIVSSQDAHIVVRAWSPDKKRTVRQGAEPYPWKFEMTAPNGGFVERTGQFDFVAPESGYLETFSFEIPDGISSWDEWRHEISKEVFAKLNDGNFARFFFRYRPSSNQSGDSFKIYSFTNPSGSRNLEYDPSLEVPNQ